MSVLFPEGITHLADLPHTLTDGIMLGLQFLSFGELPKDEKPPRAIWFDGEKLKAHFEAVEKRRDEKYGGKDGDSKEIEDPVENQIKLIADE